MEIFRENLKDMIDDTSLSLRQLSRVSGVSAMHYSRYLKGGIPTIDIVLKIAQFFECSVDYLFGLTDIKNDNSYQTYRYDINQFLPRYLSLLQEHHMSHYQFSQSQAFNESILRHWQAGRKPRLDILYTIAKYFDVSIDYLIGRY